MKLLFGLLLIAVPVTYSIELWQAVAIKGKLLCNDEPAERVRIDLFDKEMFVDHFISHGRSIENGTFFLSGGADELSSLDPFVHIYHDCNDEIPIVNIEKPCQRLLKIGVPGDYIFRGQEPDRVDKVFDLGTIQLAGIYDDETRDCIQKRQR